jgi:folate-binding protein YgfZ
MPNQSPLAAVASQAGARFTEEAGWLMPAHYTDSTSEYRAARESAALVDLSHRGKVALSGPDAPAFLHNLCTNDVARLTPGLACEAFLTTAQAKVVAHAWAFCEPAADGSRALWLDLAPGKNARVLQHLNYFLITEQVELVDQTAGLAQVHLVGPQAPAIVDDVLGQEFAGLAPLAVGFRLSDTAFAVQVRRTDLLGWPGYDIVCAPAEMEAFWDACRNAGAAPAGLETFHVLRVEAGLPLDGVDIDDSALPQEIGRTERAVSFTKGCYIGQETIARIRTYGHVNRYLRGLRVSAAAPPLPASRVFREGKEVGHVTSAVLSPLLGSPLALAFVRRGSDEPGTKLEVDNAGQRLPAEIVAWPLAPHAVGDPP